MELFNKKGGVGCKGVKVEVAFASRGSVENEACTFYGGHTDRGQGASTSASNSSVILNFSVQANRSNFCSKINF